jgi:hypothetical protein
LAGFLAIAGFLSVEGEGPLFAGFFIVCCYYQPLVCFRLVAFGFLFGFFSF